MDVFKSLGHIAIKVKDIDASLAFYNKLGIDEMLRFFRDDKLWIVNRAGLKRLGLPKGSGPRQILSHLSKAPEPNVARKASHLLKRLDRLQSQK